ncbi:protein-disulfide reductase DsbD [Glaciecola sp. SC05]|uniref:protein-disulfide reductase DsbD n=1 Tax=Glaciecola sp. SC05 TaxID=1987355 RepID=UPI00352947D6
MLLSNKSISFRNTVSQLMLYCLLSLVASAGYAQQTPESLFADAPTFLKVDEAFGFDFEQRDGELIIKWDIAEGYYLYKKQFQTVTRNATLGEPVYPAHETIEDEFFGLSDVFFQDMQMTYSILESAQDGQVKIRFQGCAEAGLCYPPTTKVIFLDAYQPNGAATADTALSSGSAVSEQFTLAERLLSDESLAISLGILLLLGIGLAFTPCVYPMYPILSSIVMGKNKSEMKLSQAFILSFVYVQGMAITYSILGLIVASAGVQFQAALQHPVLLGIFIILFVALALAMFGLYEIQLPSKWQEKLSSLSNNQKSGNLVGVFIMGVISGLVASPCTTAPLTAILLVVAQSESLIFGFSALYALSLGMGIPLILFGMTGGKLLPKAGNWMNVIKATFGFMMLTVAILFVERIYVAPWTELLWAILGLSLFAYLFTMNQDTKTSFAKGVRSLVVMTGFVASVLYSVQALQVNNLLPSSSFSIGTGGAQTSAEKASHPEFMMIRDLDDFDIKLAAANAEGKSVMVDLYADWCVACKEFEKYTFPDPAVISALENTVWMQIDLTDNTPVNLSFQEEFQVLGLPTILFFDAQGNELEQSRVTGFMKADAFASHINRSLNN